MATWLVDSLGPTPPDRMLTGGLGVHAGMALHPKISQTHAIRPCSPPSTTTASPRLLCKYNLHQLVCRLVRQAQLRGHSSNYMELWGENYIQYLKSATKYRSTAYPERVIVKTLLVDAELARLSVHYPEHTRSFDELIPQYRSGQMRGKNIDSVEGASSGIGLGPGYAQHMAGGMATGEVAAAALGAGAAGGTAGAAIGGAVGGAAGGMAGGSAAGGAAGGAAAAMHAEDDGGEEDHGPGGSADVPLLLGTGKALRGEEAARVEQSIRQRLEDMTVGWPPLEGWHTVWIDMETALAYQHADQGGGGFSFKSVTCTRATERVSYYALVRYIEGNDVAAYVAKIHYFVKLTPASPLAAQAAAQQLKEAAAALRIAGATGLGAARGRGRGNSRHGKGRSRRANQQRATAAQQAAEEAAATAETAAGMDPPSPLRVALCDLYKARTVTSWRGTAYYVPDLTAPWKSDVSLPLDELSEKVVVCSRLFDKGAQRTAAAIQPTAWFITYENLSRTTLL